MNQNFEQITDTIELSQLINNLLEQYRDKTKDINILLLQDDEDNLKKINEILAQREIIINRYNIIKEKYDSLVTENSPPELQMLEQQRQELLGLIKAAELLNVGKANELLESYKDKIREINTGRKAIQAYGNTGPLADGFFIDKRK